MGANLHSSPISPDLIEKSYIQIAYQGDLLDDSSNSKTVYLKLSTYKETK